MTHARLIFCCALLSGPRFYSALAATIFLLCFIRPKMEAVLIDGRRYLCLGLRLPSPAPAAMLFHTLHHSQISRQLIQGTLYPLVCQPSQITSQINDRRLSEDTLAFPSDGLEHSGDAAQNHGSAPYRREVSHFKLDGISSHLKSHPWSWLVLITSLRNNTNLGTYLLQS